MGGESSRQKYRPNTKLLTQTTVDTIGDCVAKWNGLRIRLHQVEVREIKKLMEETVEVMHKHNMLEVRQMTSLMFLSKTYGHVFRQGGPDLCHLPDKQHVSELPYSWNECINMWNYLLNKLAVKRQDPGFFEMMWLSEHVLYACIGEKANQIQLQQKGKKAHKYEDTTRRDGKKDKETASPNADMETTKNKKKLHDLDKQLQKAKEKNQQLEQDLDKANAERKDLRLALRNTEEENKDLLMRLSKIAGEKMTFDNPNIADLSDMFRPTKLGEVYTELYDNEWTDAFESLEKAGYSDREAIDTLLDTLLHVHAFCKTKSEKMVHKTTDAVNLMFEESKEQRKSAQGRASKSAEIRKETPEVTERWKSKQGRTSVSEDNNLTAAPQKEAKDIKEKIQKMKKDVAVPMAPLVKQAYMQEFWTTDCIPRLKPYIKKCVFVCWMMVVQTPALGLQGKPKHGEKFDTTKYRSYLTSGPTTNFAVWPALLLYEGGPVLAKGVAEANRK